MILESEKMRVNAPKSGKAKVSVSFDKNVLKKAHDLGLNVSKVCENVLKVSIEALENRNKQTLSFTGVSLGEETPMELGMGIASTAN